MKKGDKEKSAVVDQVAEQHRAANAVQDSERIWRSIHSLGATVDHMSERIHEIGRILGERALRASAEDELRKDLLRATNEILKLQAQHIADLRMAIQVIGDVGGSGVRVSDEP